MTKLQLLHGPDVRHALNATSFEGFTYQVNPIGMRMAFGVGGVLLLGAGLIWWLAGLASPLYLVGFGILAALGTAVLGVAAHWMTFARREFVAVSREFLFIGRKDRLWRVSWSLLDKKALGFHDMDLTRIGGALDIDVAGQQIKLHLFNAFANLEDIQGFMLIILEHLKQGQAAAGDDDDEPDIEESNQ